ncbi:MAG: hypothetical protein ACYTAN_18760, partial [Planctomycetota bacterium]
MLLAALTLILVRPCLAGAAEGGHYEPKYFETRPGVLFYTFQDDTLWEKQILSVRRRAKTDFVTPVTALEISFPLFKGEPGVVALDIDQALGTQDQPSKIPPDA